MLNSTKPQNQSFAKILIVAAVVLIIWTKFLISTDFLEDSLEVFNEKEL